MRTSLGKAAGLLRQPPFCQRGLLVVIPVSDCPSPWKFVIFYFLFLFLFFLFFFLSLVALLFGSFLSDHFFTFCFFSFFVVGQ